MRMIRFTGLATSGLAVFALAVAGLVTPQVSQAQDGPYTVCSDIPWPPFEMTDEGDNFGFDLDVMRAVAVVEGYDIEIQNLSFDAIIPSLRSGKCDVGASGFTITEKRARVVDFSDPYYLSNQAVLMRKDSDVGLVQALSGGTIGVQRGTTGEAWLKEHLVEQGFDVTLKRYETYPLAVMDLANGRIDAVLQDTGGSKASVAAYPDKLQSAAVINTFEYYGNPVQQGDPNDLLPRISEGKAKLGLDVVESAGSAELHIQPDTAWANLTDAYFGADNDAITAAWHECKDGILNAEDKDDVDSYAQCMADAVKD